MANSKKLQKKRPNRSGADLNGTVTITDSLAIQIHAFLKTHLTAGEHLLVAFSGGLDSTVLLYLLSQAKQNFPFELHAMHVHHGLSSNADKWAAFCEEQCRLLDVPFQITFVDVDKNSQSGVESAARQLRYEALFSCKLNTEQGLQLQPAYTVTGHHQDDQAETLLVQLFRGAGIKGLSSMAEVDNTRGLLRPLLSVSRKTLQDYAELHHIPWCEDESNEDTQYERNFVRHEVLPLLETRHQATKSVLARTASHIAEANQLLDTLAQIDTEKLLEKNSLCLEGFSQLSLPRAKNSLRWWLARNQLAMPTSEHLDEIVQQLLNAKQDANISMVLQGLTLKRFQKRAYLSRYLTAQAFDLVWNGEPQLALPNGGSLEFKQVMGAGLALKFGMTKLRINNRDGGERFKPNALRPTRTLKHLLQEANIPPWRREFLPLVYWQDTLAFVPGIGIAHELQAKAQELGIEIVWHEENI